MTPYLVVLIAYSAALILMGSWVRRRVTGAADFFVAGRSLGPVLLGSSVLAANIGAGSTIAASGLAYQHGLSAWWWVGAAGIGTLLLAHWIGPRLRQLSAARGYYTVGDLLEARYGAATRAVLAALLWLGSLAILSAQFLAFATVLEPVAGIPKALSVTLGGVAMTVYFAAGGLAGAAWINAVQLVVLLGGFIVAVPLALAGIGGVTGLLEAGAAVNEGFGNVWGTGESSWLAYLALLVPNFMISPGLAQKVFGARDDRAVRWGLTVAGVALLVFSFAPTLLGMIARVQFPDLSEAEHALPVLLIGALPITVGAIGIGSLFMAEVSSADAILFMLSTSLSKDLYKRFINPDASDTTVLRVARLAAIAGGVGGIVFGLVAETVVDAMTIFYAIVGVTLFVPVVAALYKGRYGAPEAFAAFGCGIGATIITVVWLEGPLFGIIPGRLLGLLAAGAGFFAVGLVRR